MQYTVSKSGRRTMSRSYRGGKDITSAEPRSALAEMGLTVSVACLHRVFPHRGMNV